MFVVCECPNCGRRYQCDPQDTGEMQCECGNWLAAPVGVEQVPLRYRQPSDAPLERSWKLAIWGCTLAGPLIVACLNTILYYSWKTTFPRKAGAVQLHGWLAFFASFVISPLLMCGGLFALGGLLSLLPELEHVTLTEAERSVLVDAHKVLPMVGNDTPWEFAEEVSRQRGDDGSFSLEYNYEYNCDDSPAIHCRVHVDASEAAAEDRFAQESRDTEDYIQQLRSEGVRVERNDTWFSWGDESTLINGHGNDLRYFLFECRDGRRVFVLMIVGPFGLEWTDLHQLLKPPLTKLATFEGHAERTAVDIEE